jgi:hypothetical protein
VWSGGDVATEVATLQINLLATIFRTGERKCIKMISSKNQINKCTAFISHYNKAMRSLSRMLAIWGSLD